MYLQFDIDFSWYDFLWGDIFMIEETWEEQCVRLNREAYREKLAMAALSAFDLKHNEYDTNPKEANERIAKRAFAIADAMLVEAGYE
jgi:hypothetical protein